MSEDQSERERLHAVVHDGDGPYALLVHGAIGSRSYWADNLGPLSEVCRPVVVELWGHGRSPSPVELSRYDPIGYVAEFERLRLELGAEQWITIGQSMGAALTLRYGLAAPERIIAQIITNSSSAFSPVDSWAERHRTSVTAMVEEVRRNGIESLRDHWVNPGRSRRISAPTRSLLAAEFDEHDPVGIAESLMITNAQLPLGDLVAEVCRPTLLTVGTDEERFVELMPRAQQIPGLEVVELAASHAVNAHDPEGWNAAAVAFISRHR